MIRNIGRNESGLALMEFALVIPFLLLLFYGGIEIARYMLIAQKVDKASYALADITNQYPPATVEREPGEISVQQMNTVVFPQFLSLLEPYDAATKGTVIISSIRREGVSTRIKWQIAGGGSYTDARTVSAVSGLQASAVNGAGASLRDRNTSFTGDLATQMASMYEQENMIVSEVFFRYEPFLNSILLGLKFPFSLGEVTLVRRVYTRPRNGDLICLPDRFTYTGVC